MLMTSMKRVLLLSFILATVSCPAASQPGKRVLDASKFDSLQAAFDAVPANGGVVYLPPGDYELGSPLIVRTPETRIEGAGASTRLINKNTEGQPALHIRPDDYATNQRARMWRVQIGNFRISGNEKSGDGLLCQGIQEVFVHGLSVDHNGGHGINLENCYEDPRVSDSILTYNAKAGLNIYSGHDIVVNANHFEENQDAVRCADSFNLCMNGNNLDDHLRHGVVIENTYGSVLSGNMIEECNGTAVILDRDCYGITISANVIAHELEGGVNLKDAHGCAVSANTFVIVHQFGVRVGPNSDRIAITGNSFSNSYMGDGKDKRPAEHKNPMGRDAGEGVLIEDAQHVNITGNTFTGLSAGAVQAKGKSGKLIISANIVTDINRRAKEGKPAFDLGAARSSSIVKDNLVD